MFLPVDQLKLSPVRAHTPMPSSPRTRIWSAVAMATLPYTPKTSYSASADYEWPLADGRSAYLGTTFSHLDDVPAAGIGICRGTGSAPPAAYDMLDVRAGWDFGKVSVELAGISPTMKARLRTRRQHANGAIPTGVIRPLSFGVTVTAEFDGLCCSALRIRGTSQRRRQVRVAAAYLLFLGDVASRGSQRRRSACAIGRGIVASANTPAGSACVVGGCRASTPVRRRLAAHAAW